MSGSVNKAILVGNCVADPEIRRTQDGRVIVNLRLATSESWRDRGTGERKERSEFHRVVIFNEGLAKVAEQYLKKGSKVYLEGQIQTREYEAKDGSKRYVTEIVLQGFNSVLTMLDGPGGNGDRANRDTGGAGGRSESGGYGDGTRAAAGSGGRLSDQQKRDRDLYYASGEDPDGDIPF